MAEIKNASDYVIIATLASGSKIEVSITFKGENTLDNLYVLNKYPFDEKDLNLFKKLFYFFESKQKTKDFVDFFVYKNDFYATFKYTQAENIKQKYNKILNTATFEERCIILGNILIKIDQLFKLPPEILACITEPENICVDNEKKVCLTYNLKNVYKDVTEAKQTVFQNIHDIIFIMLQQEAEAGFNKSLHIVLDKCKRAVYNSIPELTIELKKAEKLSQTSSWWTYIKYQFSLRQKIITKLTQTTIVLAIVIGLGYLAYSKINEGKNQLQPGAAPVVAIGDISYNGNKEDESAKDVSTEKEKIAEKSKASSDIVLMEGLDMDYEDYIVQHTDTIESVCKEYYKDTSFITAVATFNGLQTNEKLVPGSILKLPNRTAIALYISR